jgi:hypothetical protein
MMREEERKGSKGRQTRKGGTPMEVYPSDLSDAEWAILEPLIPPEKPGGRPRQVEMRAVQSADLLRAASGLCLAHDPT